MTVLEARAVRTGFGQVRTAATDLGERHRSVQIVLAGRFMRPDKTEYPCKLIDISVAHMTLTSPVRLSLDEKVIAYCDHIGGLEGTVTAPQPGQFAMRLNITTRKREKLAAQLTWLINRSEFTGLEERRHERVVVGDKTVAMRVGDEMIACALLDISLSGASLGTHARPATGTEVLVGMQHAIVRRHHEHGIGVQFLQVQEAKALQSYLG